MIYLNELPSMEVEEYKLYTFSSTTKVFGRSKVRPFKCISKTRDIQLGIVYDSLTLCYDLSYFTNPFKSNDIIRHQTEITFRGLYASDVFIDHDLSDQHHYIFTCDAESFMVTKTYSDNKLGWLERQALEIDRQSYITDAKDYYPLSKK
jgi:hypothetical protein